MKKRFSFWALMLAVALALSLVLTACGKKDDDNNDDGGNTGGGGTTSGGQIALVDASDLADKLFLMYTFEDADVSGKISAVDPYTGAAVESGATYGANSKLVSTPGTNVGGSKKAFDPASDTLTLSNTFADSTFKEMVDDGGYYVLNTSAEEVTGVSVSFWAYNNETYTGDTSGGESADWSNVINTEYLSLTWGNISDKVNASEGKYGAIFPGEDAVLGRAAYPASMYEDAQKNLTQSQITAAPDTLSNDNDWWAFNAISGTLVGSDEDDTDAAKAMAGQCLQTWRYITIDINYKTGISFYANGALAYNYTPNAIEKWYNSSSDKKVSWANMYEYILLGLMENGAMDGSSIIFQLFNGECGIYVDDLIIGQSLTATEAEHLYEDLASAATGTTVDVDTSITSTMQGSQEAQQEAEEKAMQNALAQAQADVESVSEQLLALKNPGEITVGGESQQINTVMRADYDNNDDNNPGNDWWNWNNNNTLKADRTDTGFTFVMTGYNISRDNANVYEYGPSLGIWYNNGNTAIRPDMAIYSDNDELYPAGSYSYKCYENGSEESTANGLPSNWENWRQLLICGKIKMSISYEEATHTFTIEWQISAVNAGKTYTGRAVNAETQAEVTMEYTVPEIAYRVVCTATDTNVDAFALMDSNFLHIYGHHSAFFVTEVTGGTLS